MLLPSVSLTGLFLALLWMRLVLAGHFMFEPQIRHETSSMIIQNLDINESLSQNQESYAHGRRWVTPDFADGDDASATTWPQKTMYFWFTDANSATKLRDDLKAAMNLWYYAGLSSDFLLIEVLDEDDRDDQLPYVLYVTYEAPTSEGGTGMLVTTIGVPNSAPEGKPLASMTLSDDDTKGTRNVISNYAHELGHAWGLRHEHQNPYYWSSDFENGKGSTIFTTAGWNCESLADYATAVKKADDEIAASPANAQQWQQIKDTMCTNRMSAARLGFSAKEWLPLTGQDIISTGTTSKTDIDLASIMLYPSVAGGSLGSDGERAEVLTQADGNPIPTNTEPSNKDVLALHTIYGDDSDDDVEELLNDSKSSHLNTFNSIRNSDKDVSCD